MSKTEDVSVIGGLYSNRALRFGVFPELKTDFEPTFYLEPLSHHLFQTRWSEQGTLICQHENIHFLYEPASGIFKISHEDEEILNGSLQTGQFSQALFFLELKGNERIYGLGAASPAVHRNDQEFQLFNQDPSTSLSKIFPNSSSFPFFLIEKDKKYTGILWNSTCGAHVKTVNQANTLDRRGIYISLLDDDAVLAQDFFVFTGSAADVVTQLLQCTGAPFLPPLWTLGYHHFASSTCTAEGVLRTLQDFRRKEISCDAVHLNTNYMQDHKAFTWDANRFSDPAHLHKELDALGIHSVATVLPSIPLDPNDDLYLDTKDNDYFCKNNAGDLYVTNVLSGKSVFPDFTRKKTQDWWTRLHKILLNVGVSGICNEMNGPALKLKKKYNPRTEDILHSRGPHYRLRNVYASLQAKATKLAFGSHGKTLRPWILSASGFTGIQKQAAILLHSRFNLEKKAYTWQSLRQNLNMVLNLSLSGVPHVCLDLTCLHSGHFLSLFSKYSKQAELFVRSLELSSLMPVFGTHVPLASYPRNSWRLNNRTLAICRKHITRRYHLLPYFYTLSWEMHRNASLWIRPLFYEFPEISPIQGEDQFLIGPSLLAAPVLHKDMKLRKVYLPPGDWYEYESGRLFPGDSTHYFKVYPGYYPLFVKAGSILPVCFPKQNAQRSFHDVLILEVYPAKEMQGKVYLDNGRNLDYKNQVFVQLELKGSMSSFHSLWIDIQSIGTTKHRFPFRYIQFCLPAPYRYLQSKLQKHRSQNIRTNYERRSLHLHSFVVPFALGRYTFKA